MDPIPHHLNIEAVLPGLAHGLAAQVGLLLERGFTVTDAWGPVQMSVCGVVLKRGDVTVTLDSEVGWTTVTLDRGDFSCRLREATLVWARLPGPDGKPPRPDYFPGGYDSVASFFDPKVKARAAVYDNGSLADVAEWFPACNPEHVAWVKDFEERHLTIIPFSDTKKQYLAARAAFDAEWAAQLAAWGIEARGTRIRVLRPGRRYRPGRAVKP